MLALHVAASIWHIEVHLPAFGHFYTALYQAIMNQEVAHATFGNGNALRRRGAAAAQFGRHKHLALALAGGVEEFFGIQLKHHHGVRRTKRFSPFQGGLLLSFVIQHVGSAKRQNIQRAAARVQVEHHIAHGHQHAGEVVGNLRGHRAVRVARKAAVQVAFIHG